MGSGIGAEGVERGLDAEAALSSATFSRRFLGGGEAVGAIWSRWSRSRRRKVMTERSGGSGKASVGRLEAIGSCVLGIKVRVKDLGGSRGGGGGNGCLERIRGGVSAEGT